MIAMLIVKENQLKAPALVSVEHDLSFIQSWNVWLIASIAWLALVSAFLLGGPRLGDHEVIVAQTARQMLLDGDWIVPHYLDTPFLVKPPLPYWGVAIVSAFLPADPSTGLPVSAATARLPSILATLFTAWIVWRLGKDMFGSVAGRMATIA